MYGKMLVGLAEEHGDGWGGLAEVGLGSILLWVQVGSYQVASQRPHEVVGGLDSSAAHRNSHTHLKNA